MKAIKISVLTAIAIFALVSFSIPAAAEVVVIVHKDVGANSIDRASLSDIFMGKKTLWDRSARITPAILKGGATHDEFLQKYVGKTAGQFQSYWNKLLFTGAGTPPTSFKTDRDLIDFVAKTRGAVGYVDSATPLEGVKVLKVR